MHIEIDDNCLTGIYSWTLYDGPEEIDEFRGFENTLGEVFEKVILHRTQNALSYVGDTFKTGTEAP
jgi:hypothetical protein